MLLMGIALAYSYKSETQLCRDTLANLDAISCQVCGLHAQIADKNKNLSNSYQDNAALVIALLQNQSEDPNAKRP